MCKYSFPQSRWKEIIFLRNLSFKAISNWIEEIAVSQSYFFRQKNISPPAIHPPATSSSVIPKYNHFAHTTPPLCRTITTRHVASSSLSLLVILAPPMSMTYTVNPLFRTVCLPKYKSNTPLVGRNQTVVTVSCINFSRTIRTSHLSTTQDLPFRERWI